MRAIRAGDWVALQKNKTWLPDASLAKVPRFRVIGVRHDEMTIGFAPEVRHGWVLSDVSYTRSLPHYGCVRGWNVSIASCTLLNSNVIEGE